LIGIISRGKFVSIICHYTRGENFDIFKFNQKVTTVI